MTPVSFFSVLMVLLTLSALSCRGGDKAADPTLDALRRQQLCAHGDALACLPATKTPVPVPTKRCASDDLAGWASFGPDKYNPTPGPIDGVLDLTLKDGATPCIVSPTQTISMRARGSVELPMTINVGAYQDDVIIQGPDRDTDGAVLLFVWTNWCGDVTPADPLLRVQVEGKGVVDVPIVSSSGSGSQMRFPPCVDSAAPSQLTAAAGFAGRVAETTLQPCRAGDLTLTQGYYIEVAPDHIFSDDPYRVGDMWLGRVEKPGCSVTEWKTLTVLDGGHSVMDVNVKGPDGATRSSSAPRRILGPNSGYEKFYWTNWCGGARQGPMHVLLELPNDGGTIDWEVSASVGADGNLVTPTCVDNSRPSLFEIAKTL